MRTYSSFQQLIHGIDHGRPKVVRDIIVFQPRLALRPGLCSVPGTRKVQQPVREREHPGRARIDVPRDAAVERAVEAEVGGQEDGVARRLERGALQVGVVCVEELRGELRGPRRLRHGCTEQAPAREEIVENRYGRQSDRPAPRRRACPACLRTSTSNASMKRSGLLVDYASSDDDERAAPTPPPPVKKRYVSVQCLSPSPY